MDKYIEWIEKENLISVISEEFGVPKDAINSEILTELIGFLKENGARVQKRVEVAGGGPPGTLGMLISRTYYHINVKTSLWFLMGLLADIFVTRGAMSAGLVATGKIRRCFGKLAAERGDVCIYRELREARKNNQELTISQIRDKLSGNECTKEISCTRRDNETRRCEISSKAINESLNRMKEIGAVANKGEYWGAEL